MNSVNPQKICSNTYTTTFCAEREREREREREANGQPRLASPCRAYLCKLEGNMHADEPMLSKCASLVACDMAAWPLPLPMQINFAGFNFKPLVIYLEKPINVVVVQRIVVYSETCSLFPQIYSEDIKGHAHDFIKFTNKRHQRNRLKKDRDNIKERCVCEREIMCGDILTMSDI
jgi:hypothetical protein